GGEAGELDEIGAGHATDGDVETDVEEAVLEVGMDADVVAAVVVCQVLAGGGEGVLGAGGEFRAETLGGKLLDEVAHAAGPAVLAVAELAEELGDGAGDLDGLVGAD